MPTMCFRAAAPAVLRYLTVNESVTSQTYWICPTTENR